MRARNIKPALFVNEFLGVEDPFVTLLFIGLWCLADREGRLEDRTARIKAELFPYRDFPIHNGECPFINGGLTVLVRMKFIVRYEVNGSRFIQIMNFTKHQTPHHTEKKSVIPQSPQTYDDNDVTDLTVNSPLNNGESPKALRADSLNPDSMNPEVIPPVVPQGTEGANGKPEQADAIRSVIEPYRTYHPTSGIPDSKSKEWKAIAARLKEQFTADVLKAAIDGMHRTPHNLGQNDRGQKYLGLELCMRTASQVQRFVEAAPLKDSEVTADSTVPEGFVKDYNAQIGKWYLTKEKNHVA